MTVEIDDVHIVKIINYNKNSIEGVIYQYYKEQDDELAYLFLIKSNSDKLVIKVKALNNRGL